MAAKNDSPPQVKQDLKRTAELRKCVRDVLIRRQVQTKMSVGDILSFLRLDTKSFMKRKTRIEQMRKRQDRTLRTIGRKAKRA